MCHPKDLMPEKYNTSGNTKNAWRPENSDLFLGIFMWGLPLDGGNHVYAKGKTNKRTQRASLEEKPYSIEIQTKSYILKHPYKMVYVHQQVNQER